MLVRRERPDDAEAIRQVHAAAFQEGESTAQPVEVRLVDDLRRSEAWLPRLSLVADVDGEIIGHVVCSRALLEPSEIPVLGLAPIGVQPGYQREGVGAALMHAVLGAADACDETLVGLVGDPAYYGRFGFVPGSQYGIEPAVAGLAEFFQVRPLAMFVDGTAGVFRYADTFDQL
jgi:putative acetyltransferase